MNELIITDKKPERDTVIINPMISKNTKLIIIFLFHIRNSKKNNDIPNGIETAKKPATALTFPNNPPERN